MFKDRGRSLEEEYFRKHDAKLIEKLRERGKVEEIVEVLAVKLQIDDPALLRRIMALGVTLDTGAAFLLAPLVQVAWAEGGVTDREREKVLRIAAERGVDTSSPAYTSSRSGSEHARQTRSSIRPSRPSRAGSPSSRRRNALTASADRRRLPRGGVGIRWPRATARPGHGRL